MLQHFNMSFKVYGCIVLSTSLLDPFFKEMACSPAEIHCIGNCCPWECCSVTHTHWTSGSASDGWDAVTLMEHISPWALQDGICTSSSHPHSSIGTASIPGQFCIAVTSTDWHQISCLMLSLPCVGCLSLSQCPPKSGAVRDNTLERCLWKWCLLRIP